MRRVAGLLSLLLLSTAFLPNPPRDPDFDRVRPNDNRRPTGRVRDGVLRIALEVRPARWFPEADDGPSVVLPVFAEVGKPPSIPGPLIRVPTGTVVEASVANRLTDSTITIQGFLTRPAARLDSLPIAPGETRVVRFEVGAPGTYYYSAKVGKHGDEKEAEQLAGAFIVDPPGRVAPDRIFVINIWGEEIDSVTWRNAVAINGKAWPYTQRLRMDVGDSARWRIVNASVRSHPMHLHGFYFNVESSGTMTEDTIYAPDARRLAVTEDMRPFRTMSLTWRAERPGNWLFHCHIGFHVIPEAARFDPHEMANHDHNHMAGLVVGIEVRERRGARASQRIDPARLRMIVEELPKQDDTLRTIGIAIGGPGEEGEARSPGPPLIAERGRPLDVTVVNRLEESTAIHWHGLELDSYWDGVAGWSGAGGQLAPPIAARDSFVARLTVPRAGTFIYHTHLNDLSQLSAGLYGPLIVLEPGERLDPARDHLFTIGWHGAEGKEQLPIVVNGGLEAPPLELEAGVSHRLRFVNIGVAVGMWVQLWRDSALADWRVIAVDGADLPSRSVRQGPARRRINVGMTFDAEFTPAPGSYELRLPSRDTTYFFRQRFIAR